MHSSESSEVEVKDVKNAGMPRRELLRYFFAPKAIAVIGASATPGKIGYQILYNLKRRFKGDLFPVNPKQEEILELKCYPSIVDIPEEVDLAVISIPAKFVPEQVRLCGEKGVKAVIVIASGFGETGEEGKKLEEEMLRYALYYNLRIIGPNCHGIYNPRTGVDTPFIPERRMAKPEPGNLVLVSQSGAFLGALGDWVSQERIGVSNLIGIGNKVDVDETDLIDWFKDEEETGIIALYLESVKRGKEFIRVCRETSKKKPIIIFKAGRTESGARAATSHTGSIAGVDAIYDAAFKQSGVIRAESLEHMFDVIRAFQRQPLPKGDRVAIVSNGGGFGVVCADAIELNGLKVARFTEETYEYLRNRFPPHYGITNPIDLTGDGDKDDFKDAMEAVLKDENVDAVILGIIWQGVVLEDEVVEVLAKVVKKYDKPVLGSSPGGEFSSMMSEKFNRLGIPHYPIPERAIKALSAMVSYVRRREEFFRDEE
jgi:acetyl coenzyme A synthetase (ADP forming)-like protein